jgi:glycosyltransferase involved in cell wall biosynthesis
MSKKIIWISSYLPRSCGIAFYSANYISELKKFDPSLNIKIIAHKDAEEADFPVIDLKDKEWNKKVLKIIEEEKPSLVHIQHEYGLYETHGDNNEHLLDLIADIKKQGFPVIMTYHSVYKKLSPEFASFVKRSLNLLSAGIFHCEYQKEALKENIGHIPENIFVLPHGSEENIEIDRHEVRQVFGYTKKLVVGSAGLASERKGYLTIIKQWPKVVEEFPNAVLALELKPESVKETRLYINKVLKNIMDSTVQKNIEFTVRDYSKEEFYKRLKSFDVLVLPYKSESQSGVLAHGFSVGIPAIVTDIEGLGAEIRNSNAGIAVKSRTNFYKAIIKMLSSKELRDEYSRNALHYVKTVNGWSIIAKKTIEIYKKFW